MRCYRCQKFGHTATRCNNEAICSCGKPSHGDNPYPETPECANCKGKHLAKSKDCPHYKQEAAIKEIQVRENIPYPEAKAKVVIRTPTLGISYAR